MSLPARLDFGISMRHGKASNASQQYARRNTVARLYAVAQALGTYEATRGQYTLNAARFVMVLRLVNLVGEVV